VVGIIRFPCLVHHLIFRKEYIPKPGRIPVLRCKDREPYVAVGPTESSESQNVYQLHLYVLLVSEFGSKR